MKKLGLIAGGGIMPFEVIKNCINTQRPLFVVGIEPFFVVPDSIIFPHCSVKLGEAGKILNAFKQNECQEIVLAGFIKRPSFRNLIPDWKGAKILTKLALSGLSDDHIFKAIIKEIEKHGFTVVGVDEVIPQMLFSEGIYTATKPSKEDLDDIKRGVEVSLALGTVDVGQACVVQEGMVLAVEAMEGTDEMMARANTIKRNGKDPIVVKLAKPNQDKRVDLPTIGLNTIEQMKKYGMKGIAVQAGAILLLEQNKVIESANNEKIFIIGINPTEVL